MPDELCPGEIEDHWRNQPREPVRVSADDVRRKAQQLEAKTRRGFRIGAVLMACSAACYASFLHFLPGTVQRIGSSLTMAAYLYCAYQLRKRGSLRKALSDPPSATCASYRAELERLRDFSFTRPLMVPFIPGPAVFMRGFLVPELGLWKAVGLMTGVILPPFAMAIPLFRRNRRTLQREIDALDALMR
jgi:hypothetical protein